MQNNSLKILFRVDAGQKIGTGHLLECLWFAKASGFASVFCLNRDAVAKKLVRQFGFPVKTSVSISGFNSLIKKERPDIVLFDLVDIDAAYLRKVEAGLAKIVVLNALKHRLRADAQVATVFKPHAANREYFGNRYILLKPAVLSSRPKQSAKKVKNILLTFGGGDAGNFTGKTLSALAQITADFHTIVVIGGANPHFYKISRQLKSFRKSYELHHDITNEHEFIKLMRSSDLAIASGGYTLSELMYLGVPVIGLSQNDVEERHVFVNFPKNSFINLGRGAEISEQKLASAVTELIQNPAKRLRLAKTAKTVVDGKGIERLKKIVSNLIHPRVVILGAGGNLGQIIAPALRKIYPVHGFDKDRADITKKTALQKILSRGDIVLNLVGASTNQKDARDHEKLNIEAQINLLEVCRSAQIKRIVFLSTLNVYKFLSRPSGENDPVLATSPYTRTKIAAEKIYRRFSKTVPATVLRLGSVYGPHAGTGILRIFANSIKQDNSITIPRKTAYRDFLYQDDLVDLIKLAVSYNDERFAVFNGASGKHISFLQLARAIQELIPKLQIKYNNDANISTWGNPALVRKILGFRAKTKLTDGLKLTLNI